MSLLDGLFEESGIAAKLATSNPAKPVLVDGTPPTPGQVLTSVDDEHARWDDSSAAIGISSNAVDALAAADSPSGANPFVTSDAVASVVAANAPVVIYLAQFTETKFVDSSNFADAMAQAMADLPSTFPGGCTLMLPSGTFPAHDDVAISVPGNNIFTGSTGPINIISAGRTTVTVTAAHDGPVFDVGNNADPQVWFTGTIRGVRVLGNGSDGCGFHLYGVVTPELDDCAASGFTGAGGWGLQLDAIGGKLNQGLAMRGCDFGFNDRGARLFDVNTTLLDNCRFNQNTGARSQVLLANALVDFRNTLLQSTSANHQVHVKKGASEACTITPVAANASTYTASISIDGGSFTNYTYTSDASATVSEITAGLVALIVAGSQPVTAIDNSTNLIVDVAADGLYRTMQITLSGTGSMSQTHSYFPSHITMSRPYGESTGSANLLFLDPTEELSHVVDLSNVDQFFTSANLVNVSGIAHRVTIHGVNRDAGCKYIKARGVLGGIHLDGVSGDPETYPAGYDLDAKSLSALTCNANGRTFNGSLSSAVTFDQMIAPYLRDAFDPSKPQLHTLVAGKYVSGFGVKGGTIAPTFTGAEVAHSNRLLPFIEPGFRSFAAGKTLKMTFTTPIPANSVPGLFCVFARDSAVTCNGPAAYNDGVFTSQIGLQFPASPGFITGQWQDGGVNRLLTSATLVGANVQHAVLLTQQDINSKQPTIYIDHGAPISYGSPNSANGNTNAMDVALLGDQAATKYEYVGILDKIVPPGIAAQLMELACEKWAITTRQGAWVDPPVTVTKAIPLMSITVTDQVLCSFDVVAGATYSFDLNASILLTVANATLEFELSPTGSLSNVWGFMILGASSLQTPRYATGALSVTSGSQTFGAARNINRIFGGFTAVTSGVLSFILTKSAGTLDVIGTCTVENAV